MRLVIPLFSLLSLILSPVFEYRPTYAAPTTPAGGPVPESLWHLDLGTVASPVRQDLAKRGYLFEKDMRDGEEINLAADARGLVISTDRPAFGLLTRRDLRIGQADWVEIDWGVDRYPEEADWSRGRKREPIMVYLFFGDPVPADRFYLPDSPYFIGLFLGRNETPLTPYTGESYTASGRYVCLGSPEPGRRITSRFNFAAACRQWFGFQHVPPVTGIAIELDTKGLPDGASAAFINRISLRKLIN